MTDYIDTALDQPKYAPLAHVCLSYDECAANSCGACLNLPVAPACVTISGALSRAPHTSSLAPIPSSSDGQEPTLLQSPNLRDRWQDAVNRARAAQSPIDRRIWTEHALSITEMIVSPSVCDCGVALSALTGRCEACDERHEQLMADRRRFGAMAIQRDAGVPF